MLSLAPAIILLSGPVGAPTPDPSPVYGGEAVADCGWPTTLHAQSCTATLVHPEVVVLAAHCPDPPDVFLGQWIADRQEPDRGRAVPVQSCVSHPDYEGSESLGLGVDIKACVLAEPVDDVPIVPILMGCETSVLQPGKDVTIVGFGVQDIGMSGAKVEVTTPINEVMPSGEVDIGGDGKDSCNGDSGGPVYVQLTEEEGFDGSWRVFGVTSYGKAIGLNSCGMGGYYTQMTEHVPWIEDNVGIDITPCHDADGTWNPGPDCHDFPLRPMDGSGQWNRCDWSSSPATGWSRSCGLQHDDAAPTIAIEWPPDGTRLAVDGEDEPAAVPVGLLVDDADGTGVTNVELTVRGEDGAVVDQQALEADPFQPDDVELFPGTYTLFATATDGRHNHGESETVSITIEALTPPDGTGAETDEPDPEPEPEAEGESDAGEGCGCRTHPPRGTAALAWLLLGLRGRRRPS